MVLTWLYPGFSEHTLRFHTTFLPVLSDTGNPAKIRNRLPNDTRSHLHFWVWYPILHSSLAEQCIFHLPSAALLFHGQSLIGNRHSRRKWTLNATDAPKHRRNEQERCVQTNHKPYHLYKPIPVGSSCAPATSQVA